MKRRPLYENVKSPDEPFFISPGPQPKGGQSFAAQPRALFASTEPKPTTDQPIILTRTDPYSSHKSSSDVSTPAKAISRSTTKAMLFGIGMGASTKSWSTLS
jgi:hypothetical protein